MGLFMNSQDYLKYNTRYTCTKLSYNFSKEANSLEGGKVGLTCCSRRSSLNESLVVLQ